MDPMSLVDGDLSGEMGGGAEAVDPQAALPWQ
jgi:hypothetical protein